MYAGFTVASDWLWRVALICFVVAATVRASGRVASSLFALMFVRLAAYELLCVVCIPRMEHSNRRISEFEHRRRRKPLL